MDHERKPQRFDDVNHPEPQTERQNLLAAEYLSTGKTWCSLGSLVHQNEMGIHGCDFAPNVVPIMPVWALSLLSLWQLDMRPAEATETGTASIGIGTVRNVGMVQCLK